MACRNRLLTFPVWTAAIVSIGLLNTASARSPKEHPSVSFDVAAVNNALLSDLVGPDSRGAATLRAQILLDRANFSPGQIDGSYGKNMRAAISAFQKSRRLPENGLVNAETWRILNGDSATPLQTYIITNEDLIGPFTKIPRTMAAKAKLEKSNFESPTEALAEKFHCAPALLKSLNPQKRFDGAGESLVVPNVVTVSLPPAASIVVSGTENGVSVVDSAGNVVARFPASIGSEHDPLPVGRWKVLGVKRDPFFHYNPQLFWDADSSDSKSKIPPGPNNPVGVVWISLSKPHYGIHGTPEPSQIGYTQSHGCIRLTNWDAQRLASAVKPGTPAVLEK